MIEQVYIAQLTLISQWPWKPRKVRKFAHTREPGPSIPLELQKMRKELTGHWRVHVPRKLDKKLRLRYTQIG